MRRRSYNVSMDIVSVVKSELAAIGGEISAIGKSVCGRDILCLHRGGYSGMQLVITAAIHARECYTALVVLEQARRFDKTESDGVYFVPLVNPDGAVFFESGDCSGSDVLCRFRAHNRVWKANANGVDLNCNFDANFGSGVMNKFAAGPNGYVGAFAHSEPESAALVRLTHAVKPAATVSYHCMGGELYWEFFQSGEARRRDKTLATAIAAEIGAERVDGDLRSAGGYKDYCVQKLGIPAFTIELIKHGTHPFSPDDFYPEAQNNALLPTFILRLLRGYYEDKG